MEPTQPAEKVVRKVRRGLAKKQNVSAADAPPAAQSIQPNTSVYSSCVSRGFSSIMKSINPLNLGLENGSTQENLNNKVTGFDVQESTSSSIKSDFTCDATKQNNQDDQEVDSHDEVDLTEQDGTETERVGVETLRSPTPPPDGTPLLNKKRRMNRKMSSALKALNQAKGCLLARTPSNPWSKSRSACRPVPDRGDDSPINRDIAVKVRYLSFVHRIQMRVTDSFTILVQRLSAETGQEQQHLSLFLNDQALPLTQTPQNVGLTVADIIECHCVKGDELVNESLRLLVQSSNRKRKTEITVKQRQPFSDILQIYAEQAGVSVAGYQFSFDGDAVNPSDTPLSLDMDDEDVLDLVPVLTPRRKKRAAKSALQNAVISLI